MRDLNALPLPQLFDALVAGGALDRLLAAARDEDLGAAGDVTTGSIIEADRAVRATGSARAPGVVAGLRVLPRLLDVFDCPARLETIAADGDRCVAGAALWRLHGALAPILGAERTMLNIVGRLSGIATLTARYVDRTGGTRAVICGTRKTMPGMRALEKYAVRCGGGMLHRLGLHDAVLLKDNHLAHLAPEELAPAVARAAEAARRRHDLRFVEVEVDDLEQLRALLAGARACIDVVLLDNMDPDRLREAVAMRDAAGGGPLLEASGGIGLDDVAAVAATGVDRISVGAITHSAPWLDVGLDIA